MTLINAKITPPKLRGIANFNMVTPDKFRKAFKDAQNGKPADLWRIMDWFLSIDGHLAGVLQSRISAVTRAPFHFATEDDTQAYNNLRDELKEVFKVMRFIRFQEELLKGSFYGVRPLELVWGTVEINGKKRQAPIGFNKLPHSFLYADKKGNSKNSILYLGDKPLEEYETGHIVSWQNEEMTSYADIDFTELGCGLSAMRYSIIKYFDVEDWAAFNEVFGMPLRVGKYKAGTAEKDIERLEEAVHGMGSDASAVVSEDTDIEIKESNRPGSISSYETLANFCNREINKAITSEALTGSDGTVGTYGAMQTANGIRLDVAEGDATIIQELIQENIIDIYTRLNYGSSLKPPLFQKNIKAKDDLLKQVQIDQKLFDMNIDFSLSAMRERYNIPAPKDDEDTLAKPQGGGLLGL